MPDTTIPARRGKAAYVAAGQVVRMINTHGEQVVDTWAFNRHDMTEFMSMEHSRATMQRLIPRVGDALLTNHRRPILTVLEDTSGGIHDTLMAACDRYRYQELGCTEYHDNCTDNLAQGLGGAGPDAAGDAEPAQPVHEHPVDGGGRAVIRTAGVHAGHAISGCAPRWTWSSRSPPVRRTSCRSTAARGNRPRRISASRRSFCHREEPSDAAISVVPCAHSVIEIASSLRSSR